MSSSSKLVQCDVCIVGSGFAGSLLAYKLATQGVKVILVEAGNKIETATQSVEKPMIDQEESSTDFPYFYHGSKGIGGSSLNWFGNTPRFFPEDFNLFTSHQVGADFPISYEQIEPFYCEAEKELGISGGDHPKLPWRSQPFPLPAHPFSYSDKVYQKLLKERAGLELIQIPMARNSRPYQGRGACHGFQKCISHCPTRAKYRTDQAHLYWLESTQENNFQILSPLMVTGFEVSRSTRKVERALARRMDGSTVEIKAKVFAIAANAIQTPRLLLHSKSELCPNGLSNHNGLVGRYLMDHPAMSFEFNLPDPLFLNRGPAQTAFSVDKARGSFRNQSSAMLIEVNNIGKSLETYRDEALERGLQAKLLKEYVQKNFGKDYSVKALFEILPNKENRVELSHSKVDDFGVPLPKVTMKFSDYERKGFATFEALGQKIAGTSDLKFERQASVCHWMGTCRMSQSEKTGVVDREHRSFEHPNLFLVGGSNFVTGGVCNPTLTLSAFALRAAGIIAKQLHS